MRVTDIALAPNGQAVEFGATVHTAALRHPFRLRISVPGRSSPSSGAQCGSALVAALLVPAMQAGEGLEIPAPLSPKLRKAIPRLQSIFRCWEPTLSSIEVDAPDDAREHPTATKVGLFYSCGLDSSYSLAKNVLGHPLNEDVIDTLICIHGIDILDSEERNDIFEALLHNTREIAASRGKAVLTVRSNLRELTDRLGVSWNRLVHGSALTAAGLLMADRFSRIYIASSRPYNSLEPSGSHPLTDPLWSTETLTFIHDGCEAGRLDKMRFLAGWPEALNKLRVCWAIESKEYNCGRCSKCVKAMLSLHILGIADKCHTLPASLDPQLVADMQILHPDELSFLTVLLNELGAHKGDAELQAALRTCIERAKHLFDGVSRAHTAIRKWIPLTDKFIWVDAETVREHIGAGRKAVPFLEKEGVWFGHPADDSTAIGELERLRGEGARFIAFWRGEFWWLDHYREFNRHLRSNYTPVVENDDVIIFPLHGAAANVARS